MKTYPFEPGMIPAFPLAGWTLHSLPEACVLLQLDLVPSEQALQTGERLSFHLSMRAAQSDELAAALQQAAAATRMGQAPSEARN